MKASQALFRMLLHAYPARFRRAWGEEMAEVFESRLNDTRGGRRRSQLWLRTILDIAATATAERGREQRRGFGALLWPAPEDERRPFDEEKAQWQPSGETSADQRYVRPAHLARGEPLGRRLRLGDPSGPWRTIVGVVGDVRHDGLDARP